MSVVEKIKAVSRLAEEMGKERPKVTVISDSNVILENYNYIKHFDGTEIIVEFKDYDIRFIGMGLVIESFTPMRITLEGKIKEIAFVSSWTEESV